MRTFLVKISLLVLQILLIAGCAGGGSAGTGTGAFQGLTIEGRVLDLNSVPVANATVTVKETGDSDISDPDGNFAIETEAAAGELTLEIATEQSTSFTTITVKEGDSTLQITVKINPLISEADSSQLEVNAKIVGTCDVYFENFRVIRQANPVPGQLTCNTKVRVESNGLPLAHVPIAIQFRACPKNSPWATIALGATMTGGNLGVGQVPFTFRDDAKHCLYRILSPFDTEGVKPVIYEIQTLTYQSFLKK